MKSFKFIFITIVLILQSCSSDNNCNQFCFTPPNSFLFELVNKTSGENLFTNGTYESADIKILNSLDSNSRTDFTFISENDINLIQIGSIGWETEIVNLKFIIADNHLFDFYADAERKSGECCDYTLFNETKIIDAEFEFDNQTGIYKILID